MGYLPPKFPKSYFVGFLLPTSQCDSDSSQKFESALLILYFEKGLNVKNIP